MPKKVTTELKNVHEDGDDVVGKLKTTNHGRTRKIGCAVVAHQADGGAAGNNPAIFEAKRLKSHESRTQRFRLEAAAKYDAESFDVTCWIGGK